MKSHSLGDELKAAARAEVGFVLLALSGVVVGAVQVFFVLPELAEAILFVVGGAMTVLGSTGFGAALGRGRTDEMLRLKLEPPYRRTIGLYEAMSTLAWDLGQSAREVIDATRPSGLVDARVVSRSQVAMDTRLSEQTKSFDVALAEWRELVPEKVDETKATLRKEGRLR